MKYIITQTQLEDIQALTRWLCFGECRVTERAIPTSAQIIRMLESIKPIEPLTPTEVKKTASKHPSEDLCGWSYRMGIADAEHHILGETQ